MGDAAKVSSAGATMVAGMAPIPELSLELRSNPLYLSGAREMIASIAKRLGFAEEACGQIALAVDEALCNVIRHGYNRDPGRPIWIRLFPEGNGWGGPAASRVDTAHPDGLRIVIEDEAQQVDPAAIRSRDLEEVRPGGLGVHIIKTVMDEVRYERRERVGMRLTMVKKRASGAGSGAASFAAGRAGCGCEAGGSCSTPASPSVGKAPVRGMESGKVVGEDHG